jgi:hypothetical protein
VRSSQILSALNMVSWSRYLCSGVQRFISSSFECQIVVICFRWLGCYFLNWHTVCDLLQLTTDTVNSNYICLDFFSHPSLIRPEDFQRLTNRARTTELIFSVFLVWNFLTAHVYMDDDWACTLYASWVETHAFCHRPSSLKLQSFSKTKNILAN